MPTAISVGGRDLTFLAHDLLDVPWWFAKQNAERVLRLTQPCLQGRDRRLGTEQQGLGLLHVELGSGAVAEANVRDLEAALLDFDVLPGNGQPLLESADDHVQVRCVGGQGDQDSVVIGDGCEQSGVGGLDAAPELAPEIDLPADLNPRVVIPGVLEKGAAGGVVAGARVEGAKGGLLLLRPGAADGEAQLGPGLENA